MRTPKRLTPRELEKFAQRNRELEIELADLNKYTLAFHRQWAELENALGALLYEILHIEPRNSHIAYAIYFSPTSAEARAEIVSNALLQLISENDAEDDLDTPWEILSAQWPNIDEGLSSIRIFRNKIAHGSAQRIIIRNKTHLRLMSPAFDVVRVGRTIGRRQVPGLTARDVEIAVKKTIRLILLVDDVNRAVAALHVDDNGALPKIFSELEDNLKQLRNL